MSTISTEDYAVTVIDGIESGAHKRERPTRPTNGNV